ncbi:MAG: ATP-binding protein [Acidobacteriota bacterium]
MDLRRRFLRHRKDSRLILGGLVALLAICAFVYYTLQRGRGLPAQMATNNVLLFVLWYINIILILTIVFILVRSFFRLLIERQNRILGSKFKTRLVATAISLSLIPVMILFPFATRLLLDSFDQWFATPVSEVVAEAHAAADELARRLEEDGLRKAGLVLRQVIGIDLLDLSQQADLQDRLQRLRADLDVDFLAVYDGTEPIYGTADVAAGFRRMPDPRGLKRLLERAIEDGEASKVVAEPLDVEGQLYLAAASGRRSSSDASAEPATVVLVGTLLPPDLADRRARLIDAYQSYLQLEVQKEDLRAAYLLNLLMVTLLVILAFTSISLRLARRVTVPIQALAEGTQRVSRGDLDHQVDVEVDDELGRLVTDFNHMTSELRASRTLLDRQNLELAASNERIAAVLANVAAGVLAIGPEGDILTCNSAALAILAQREDEVVSRPASEAWSDPERAKLRELAELPLVDGQRLGRQLQLTLGGEWKTLDVKVTTLPDPAARSGGRVLVLEDLTELIKAQKMAAWNEVARRIAHEIKNPLTPIRLAAERLLRKHGAADPNFATTLERGVATITREVDSLKGMVDEFSRFARMPEPRPTTIDLAALFDELVHLHLDIKPGVELATQVDAGAETVFFDLEQLKRVLLNLLDNAIEATEAPGRILLHSHREGDRLHFDVIDSGRGIRGADKERVFLPYYSTKGRGTGLGLAIVHRIVGDHHGEIVIGDAEPRGTIVSVRVPHTAPLNTAPLNTAPLNTAPRDTARSA